MTRWLFFILAAFVTLSTAAACGEPTREEYRDDIVEHACDTYRSCDRIGDGKRYASYDACMVDLRKVFNDLWPADRCGDGGIDEDQFDRCYRRAGHVACDGNGLDELNFLAQCNASNVCINPRR